MSNDLAVKAAELRKRVEDNGWEVRQNGKHAVAVGGKNIVAIPITPSDHRGIKNLEKQLERSGYFSPKPGAATKASKKALRNAGGKRMAASAQMRKALKEILVSLGEDPKYDEAKKGRKGGARARMIPEMMEAYDELGLESPNEQGGYYSRIKAWLAGDRMYADHITVLATIIAKHKKTDLTEGGQGYQQAVAGKGIVTMWRCLDCNAVFETKAGLAVHRQDAHGVTVTEQVHAGFQVTPTTTTASTTTGQNLTVTFPDAVEEARKAKEELGIVPPQLLKEQLHIRVLVALLEGNTPVPAALDLAQEVHDSCG